MPSQRERESRENYDKCYRIVQQSSAAGMRAVEIAKKLGVHRTTVHRVLRSLELMGKVENTGGTWRAKAGEQTIKPMEKEIVIELPIPKNQWQNMARLQVHAEYVESVGFSEVAKMDRAIIDKFNETRTIRIRGKNVDDLDMEKLGNLIRQATEKSSIFNLKGLLKKLKIPKPESKEKTADVQE